MGLLDLIAESSRYGQAKRSLEAQNIALEEERQKLASQENEKKSLSDYFRPQSDQSVRQTFDLPYGPMTQPQAQVSDMAEQGMMQKNPMAVLSKLPIGQVKEVGTALASLQKPQTQAEEKIYYNNKTGETSKTPKDGFLLVPNTSVVTGEGSRERMGNLEEERRQREEERISKNKADIISRFNADPSVKKAQQSIDAANTIRDLVNSDDPIAHSAIPTYSARMSGEVGNLSEADKRPFGGSQAIASRLSAIAKQAATGLVTDENKQFILQLADLVEKRAKDNQLNLAKSRAKQYGRLEIYGDENRILSSLVPEYDPMAQNQQGQTGITQQQNTNPNLKPITATNKATGQKIQSLDGGKTWQPLK